MKTRTRLFEQFQPFPAHAVFEEGEPGSVAARPRQALDEAGADRVDDSREYDRHGTGCLLQRRHHRAGSRQDHVRRECDQFHGVSAAAHGIVRVPAIIDPHVAALVPAEFLQSLPERRNAGLPFRIADRYIHEHTDLAHLVGLLRPPSSGQASTVPPRRVMNSRRLMQVRRGGSESMLPTAAMSPNGRFCCKKFNARVAACSAASSTSSKLMPMRNSMRRSSCTSAFLSAISFWSASLFR